jgi:hypothetical protein
MQTDKPQNTDGNDLHVMNTPKGVRFGVAVRHELYFLYVYNAAQSVLEFMYEYVDFVIPSSLHLRVASCTNTGPK